MQKCHTSDASMWHMNNQMHSFFNSSNNITRIETLGINLLRAVFERNVWKHQRIKDLFFVLFYLNKQ